MPDATLNASYPAYENPESNQSELLIVLVIGNSSFLLFAYDFQGFAYPSVD